MAASIELRELVPFTDGASFGAIVDTDNPNAIFTIKGNYLAANQLQVKDNVIALADGWLYDSNKAIL